VYAPISGEVITTNSELESAPEKINEDPYSAWLYKLKPSNIEDLNDLLDSTGYQKILESETR
jgi:glycine cleavage system H protein